MCSVYSVCIMSPTHNLSSKIGSECRGKIFTNGNSQSSAICASVMPNLCALCGICTSRALISAQIRMLWRLCMHFAAFVPPELCHLHRYICSAERVCTLWHLYLQIYYICTDTYVMKIVYALRGICTSKAISFAQIHLLWRTCMHSVTFVLPQSYIICTDTSVMKNVYALSDICTSRAMT